MIIALTALSQGCVDNDSAAFFIVGHSILTDDCYVEPSESHWVDGRFNVELTDSLGLPISYTFFPDYRNQLINRASEAPLRANPNDILVEGAEVLLMDSQGQALDLGGLPNPYTVLGVTFVPAAADVGDWGQAAGALELIPSSYTGAMAGMAGGRIIAEIRPYGTTTGDVDIDGDPYLWPIDLCGGTCTLHYVATEDEAEMCCKFGQEHVCDVVGAP
jgi:hypothetical protein